MAEPLFHRAHYNKIAKTIREELHIIGIYTPYPANLLRGTYLNFIMRLCVRFERDNPDFEPETFIRSCVPKDFPGDYAAMLIETWNEGRIKRLQEDIMEIVP